jgi:glucokinase
MPRKRATIGIDLGGTKTLLALFDDRFRPVDEIKIKTHAERDAHHFTGRLAEAITQLKDAARGAALRVAAVGVGCAGRPSRGRILDAPNIPFLNHFPLAARIAKMASAPVTLHNDVHAGLIGEHAFGAARGHRNALGFFIGTGIGGAIIIDNRLYVGSMGSAGDIGQYITDPLGPLSGSERAGILDNVASRSAIAGEAAVLATRNKAPALFRHVGADVKSITSSELARAIRKGDKSIDDLVRSRARMIGIVIANLANFVSPDVIVLGGGLVEAMPRLMQREADHAMRRYLNPPNARHVKMVPTALEGRAVALGAAKMALDALDR